MESCNHCHGSGENCSPASVSDRAFLSQRPCSKTLRNSCATIYFSLICQITVTGEVPTGEFKGRSLGSYYSQKEEPVQFWEKEAKIRWQSSPAKKNSCGGVPARSAVGRHAEMATFEEQTKCVVEALFSDLLGEEGTDCRNLETDSEEPAQPAGEPPIPFDPVVVASRLRRMGDQCNVDFERVSSEPLAEVLKGKELLFITREALELPGLACRCRRCSAVQSWWGQLVCRGGKEEDCGERAERVLQLRPVIRPAARARVPARCCASAAGSSSSRFVAPLVRLPAVLPRPQPCFCCCSLYKPQ
ncbi:bcl-2-like protein 15 isoform X1 [Calonectris borealis]|uniref:bcl-2-like protein 15 isoform X1 n=1 Tax=Calonectris borealis TaxID=1323832 RepID=UPI003F4C0C12